MGKQGNGFPIDRRQIYDILSIGIRRSAAVGLSIPAGKGIARFGVAVGCQIGRLVIGHDLIGRITAVGGVSIELNGIAVGAPLGKQGNGFPIDRRQIYDILSIGIRRSAAVGLSIPAGKGIARFGIAVGGQVCRLVIGHALFWRVTAVSGVAIELDGVIVSSPLGVQGD